MRTATSLHANQTRRQVDEERGHLVPSQLLLQLGLASLVDAVNLEYILGHVDANSRNLHGGRPFRFKWLMTPLLWHIGAGTDGGVHPIAYDTVHALSNAAFMRMLRQESFARIPEFAGPRVRQVSMVVAVVNGAPAQIVRCTFAILHIDEDGVLDVERWNAQQFARVGDPFASERPDRASMSQIIDAASRFIARGGSWKPDQTLLHRIEEAALLKLVCPRVKASRYTQVLR
jgi:hypothetical protein